VKRSAALLLAALSVAGCGGSRHSAAPPTALLTGVRAGGDEVTFTFRSAPLRVTAAYAKKSQVAESGSGKPVAVGAPLVAVVHFTPAATGEATATGVKLSYSGPRRLSGSGPVRDVVKISDFEADVGWAIGLDRRLPVHVSRDGSTVTVSFG
jgi:hypothetical protein